MSEPLCFVLMPFGKKPDGSGGTVDFDAVYRELIAPAIEKAGLEPLRADEESTGGIIHKPMFERLILCEYAVADLTTANANVFYELGVRHAVRPWSTVLVFAEGGRLPFDVAPQRALPYMLGPSGAPADVAGARRALVKRLVEARDTATDSPIFQLVDGLPVPEIDRTKTDVFREQVRYSGEIKHKLAAARDEGMRVGAGDRARARAGRGCRGRRRRRSVPLLSRREGLGGHDRARRGDAAAARGARLWSRNSSLSP